MTCSMPDACGAGNPCADDRSAPSTLIANRAMLIVERRYGERLSQSQLWFMVSLARWVADCAINRCGNPAPRFGAPRASPIERRREPCVHEVKRHADLRPASD